jgi:hypothetical protein
VPGPRPIRWLLVLGLPALVFLGLSLWAIDKPDVVWRGDPGDPASLTPACSLCRTPVRMYATRCPACDRDLDWHVAPKEDSPICSFCLSPGESDAIQARRRALGEEPAAARVAEALGIPPAGARAWLASARPGACGWCGGTGDDPAPADRESGDCAVCFGEGECIGCDGDRSVVVGQEDADLRIRRYERLVAGLGSGTAVSRARQEVRAANESFVDARSGTLEARRLLFWPAYREQPLPGAGPSATGFEGQPLAADTARARLLRVLRALSD